MVRRSSSSIFRGSGLDQLQKTRIKHLQFYDLVGCIGVQVYDRFRHLLQLRTNSRKQPRYTAGGVVMQMYCATLALRSEVMCGCVAVSAPALVIFSNQLRRLLAMARSRSQSMTFNGQNNDAEQRKKKQLISGLKEVTNYLKYEWPQLLDPKTNPIELAVTLLDRSSVGMAHRLDDFHDIAKQTQAALRNVVSQHHEVFNNSIGSYHLLLANIDNSQSDTQEIRLLLDSTTRDINDRCDTLLELNQTSARYTEMIEILEAMDDLTSVPDRVDQLIIDKKIDMVYDEIAKAYTVAEKYNLWSLSSMNSTQNYLEMQSNNLFDMIIDELQNEIYLRNAASHDSTASRPWLHFTSTSNPQLTSFKLLVTELDTLEQFIYNSANLDVLDVADAFTENVRDFVNVQLNLLHNHSSKHESEINYAILLNSKLNKNSESFHYIYQLLNTASKLNRLPQTVEILHSTAQQELGHLFSRITEQTKLRNVKQLGKLAKLLNFESSSTEDTVNGNNFSDSAVSVLSDLFSSLLVSCLAVMQRHKVVSEVVDKITILQSLPSTSGSSFSQLSSRGQRTYDLLPVWNQLKKELQSLIISYTYDDLFYRNQTNDGQQNNALHDLNRNDIFKFENITPDLIAQTNGDMRSILQERFPGFSISSNKNERLSEPIESPYIKNESTTTAVDVLVPKNIFNMRVILDFLLIFTAGSHYIFTDFATEIHGPENRTAAQFFETFMSTVFAPKLRDTFDNIFVEYVGSYSHHESHEHGSGPALALKTELHALEYPGFGHKNPVSISQKQVSVYQNAVDFKRLLISACSVLNTSLSFRSNYSEIVLHLLREFSNSYEQFYKELLTPGGDFINYSVVESQSRPSLRINTWMKIPALTEISGVILQQSGTAEELKKLAEKEAELMLYNSSSFDITQDDFFDNESFKQVCHLLLTSTWILTWLPSLFKNSVISDARHNDRASRVVKLRDEWCFLENGRVNLVGTNEEENVFIALDETKVDAFYKVVHAFELIRDKTLLALRYDLRCKALYYISRSYREGDWLPGNAPGDADQYVSQFNKEVFAVDDRLSSVLSDLEREGVFTGLPEFISALMMLGTQLVTKINSNGIKRILLNIFTLQQMLRNMMKLTDLVDFTKVSVFFELFTLSEQTLISRFERNEFGFTKADMLELIRLTYSEKLADGGGSNFNKSKYNELCKRADDIFG